MKLKPHGGGLHKWLEKRVENRKTIRTGMMRSYGSFWMRHHTVNISGEIRMPAMSFIDPLGLGE